MANIKERTLLPETIYYIGGFAVYLNENGELNVKNSGIESGKNMSIAITPCSANTVIIKAVK